MQTSNNRRDLVNRATLPSTKGGTPKRRFHYHGFLNDTIKSDTTGEKYHVGADLETGETWCDCKGFKSYGHCKHVDRLLARSLGRVHRGQVDLAEVSCG